MKATIHEYQQNMSDARPKTTGNGRHPLRRAGRAFLFCILLGLSASLEAQQDSSAGIEPAHASEQPPVSIAAPAVQATTCPLPVYFNYRRRVLQYDGRRIEGPDFLEMCRSIPDSSIREQVKQYDAYTAQKQKLVFSLLGSSFAGMACIGGALGNASPSTGANDLLIFTGAACLLATPVIAICTSGPHRRRKTVLFRDLPVVYNAYVEAQRRANACQ